MPPKPANPQAPGPDARCEYHIGGIRHWTNDCYHLRHRIQDLLDHQLLSFDLRGRNAYYALKNPCPSLQDESESSSICKKRKTSQIQPPISLKDRLVWPKVKDADCTEINMIYPPIRPQHRNSPDLHNVISQIVQNAQNRPTSYQAPRSTYLVPVPSQPQPLVITIPSASFFAPKVPQILTLRPIPKPMDLSTLEGTHHYQPPGTLHGKSCCALELRHRGYYRTRGKEPEVGGRNWRNDSFWKMLYSRRVGTKKEEKKGENGRY